MARTMTCDRCGDAYPHEELCPDCDGTGNHTTGTGEVYPGQCSKCRGTGRVTDPNEGKGFQVKTQVAGKDLILNVTISPFHKEPPDVCGPCLIKTASEALEVT